jgi:hypothetical protein
MNVSIFHNVISFVCFGLLWLFVLRSHFWPATAVLSEIPPEVTQKVFEGIVVLRVPLPSVPPVSCFILREHALGCRYDLRIAHWSQLIAWLEAERTTEFPPSHAWKSVLVQLANANASATKNANLKIMRAVLTSLSARFTQNPLHRTSLTRAEIAGFVVTSAIFALLSDDFTYENRRGRESNPRIAVLQTATLPLGYPAICARSERNVGARRVNAAKQSVPTNVIRDW